MHRVRAWCRTPSNLERLGLGVLAVILLIRFPVRFLASPPFLMDFQVYHETARRIAAGGGAFLYAPLSSEMMIFKYAPLWAVLWTPLAWFSTHLGGVMWTAGSVGALIGALMLGGRACRAAGLTPHPLTAVAVVLLLTRPLAEEMGNGQVNNLWLLLTMGCVVGVLERRSWLAAASLAAAISLKLPTCIFVPYLLLHRHARLAGQTLLLLLATIAGGSMWLSPTQPFSPILQWAQALTTNGTSYAFMIGNQSLLALVGRLTMDDGYGLNLAAWPPAIAWMGFGLLAVLLVLLVLLPRRRSSVSPERWLMDSALLTILMVMLSPSCWLATYMALAWPLFVWLTMLHHAWRARRAPPALLLWSALILGFSALTHRKLWRVFGLQHWRGESYLFLVFLVLPMMGLALFGYLWHRRLRQG